MRFLAAVAELCLLSSFAYHISAAPIPEAQQTHAAPKKTAVLASKTAGTSFPIDWQPFVDPAKWSQGAYCGPTVGKVINTATVVWAAGDGGTIPHTYVAYSASKNTIVVSHEGTDPTKLASDLNDVEVKLESPDTDLTGCLPAGSQLHDGFQLTWARTAAAVLAQVQQLQARYPSARVLLTGHSLGAAIATIEAAYFQCKGVKNVSTVVLGSPRVGNKQFADSVSLQNVINGHDIVPHLPPEDWGYQHSPGEVWISPANSYNFYSCPDVNGGENPGCANSVPWYELSIPNHIGTYAGVGLGKLHTCNV